MTRDMSNREFSAAMKRNGFRHEFLLWFKDTTAQTPHIRFSGLFSTKGKLFRRATIAHLIRQREAELKRSNQ